MKMSRRAKRMDRHHKRGKGRAAINMVSLMDIFTILVFFLLVNSSTVQTIPSTKALKLPTSTAERTPRETVAILVNNTDILVQGRRVAAAEEAIQGEDDVIPDLLKELTYLASRADEAPEGGNITIMGDRLIPYQLLKRIMITCTRANYTNISLAVMQKPARVE